MKKFLVLIWKFCRYLFWSQRRAKETMAYTIATAFDLIKKEFEENENSFFQPDHLRFFRLFSSRVSRLHEMVNSLLDYTNQIRDTYQSRLDVKQNRIMTVLTVVTTIFMPLTLIVGWYGMNFKYMPELDSVWGYPVVIIVSLLIVISSLLFFKRKKWL